LRENNILIEKTKSGLLTIKYNNKYIHSKYDPVFEAEQLVEGNTELLYKPVITIYGLGLGYHIDAIIKKMNSESKLYVFEYNMDLVKYCNEINRKIFSHENVNIIGGDDAKFYEKLAESLGESADIIIHRPSLETIKVVNEALYNLIDDYSLMKQSNENNEQLAKLGKENFEVNTKQNYKLINEFIDLYKNSTKPYIITASGPSLDNELDLLKKNREKFNIISVGSSLRAVMNKEIKPDTVVITDGKEIVKKQFTYYENENIPLCFYSKASRWAVNNYKGPKYIFNITDNDSIQIATESTVSVAAIDIAIKCGAKKIILLGQDLAFIENKSHTGVFEKTYGFKDDYQNKNKIRNIKDIHGNNIKTVQGYIRFKFKIESLIRRNIDIKFINCSKGAFIEGAEHMDFKTLLK
jgi:hypothetical protein